MLTKTINNFRENRVDQSDLLNLLKDEIKELVILDRPISQQIKDLNIKYNISIKRLSYEAWVAKNIKKELEQNIEKLTKQNISAKTEALKENMNQKIKDKHKPKESKELVFLRQIGSIIKDKYKEGLSYKDITRSIFEIFDIKINDYTIRTFAHIELNIPKKGEESITTKVIDNKKYKGLSSFMINNLSPFKAEIKSMIDNKISYKKIANFLDENHGLTVGSTTIRTFAHSILNVPKDMRRIPLSRRNK